MAKTVEELGNAISRMVYVVEVYRNGKWNIVGQYTAKYNADAIADECRSRGEKARVTYE